jgi:hypothetical protein
MFCNKDVESYSQMQERCRKTHSTWISTPELRRSPPPCTCALFQRLHPVPDILDPPLPSNYPRCLPVPNTCTVFRTPPLQSASVATEVKNNARSRTMQIYLLACWSLEAASFSWHAFKNFWKKNGAMKQLVHGDLHSLRSGFSRLQDYACGFSGARIRARLRVLTTATERRDRRCTLSARENSIGESPTSDTLNCLKWNQLNWNHKISIQIISSIVKEHFSKMLVLSGVFNTRIILDATNYEQRYMYMRVNSVV